MEAGFMRINKFIKSIELIDIIWFAYFCAMYIFSANYDNMLSISSLLLFLANITCYLLSNKMRLVLNKNTFYVLLWFLLFLGYELVISITRHLIYNSIWVCAAQVLLLLSSLCLYVSNPERFDRLLHIYVFSVLALALVLILTSPANTYGTTDFTGITGLQRNTSAYVIGMVAIIFVYLAWTKHNKLYYISALICAFAVIISGSRKGLIQLTLPFALIIILQRDAIRKLKISIAVLAAVFVIILILINNKSFMEIYGTRLLDMLLNNISGDTSVYTRDVLRDIGNRAFAKHPIIGYGYGASWNIVRDSGFAYVNYFHDNLVEILVNGGVIGFILYHIPFARGLLKAWKYRKRSNLAKTAFIIYTLFFILSFGQVTVYYATFYPIFFLIIRGMDYADTKEYELQWEV